MRSKREISWRSGNTYPIPETTDKGAAGAGSEIFCAALLFALPLLFPAPAPAVCKPGGPLNPVTDICWQCILPFTFGGIPILPGPSENEMGDPARLPVCFCPFPPPIFVRIGIPISFWEPARFNETVKDPFCFPGAGVGFTNGGGFLSGGNNEQRASDDAARYSKTQAHHLLFPVWSILELLTDFICVEHSGFDVAYITEVDPLWQNDILAFIIHPESLLFANPVAQLACVADSISANAGYSQSPLFWCIGSSGSAYPMTGNVNNQDFLQANETVSARLQYKLSRELLTCDTALNLCACVPTPIWVKHNYRTHIAKPVRDFQCHPFGRSDLIWGPLKNPAGAGDNFAWMIFRKRACCAF
ncbi:MAG TPA: TraU family protein [Syntrophales bacterium]|nr:TraU family protein [Syntrophales bacterium]